MQQPYLPKDFSKERSDVGDRVPLQDGRELRHFHENSVRDRNEEE